MPKWLKIIIPILLLVIAYLLGVITSKSKVIPTEKESIVVWDTVFVDNPIELERIITDVMFIPVEFCDTVIIHDSIFIALEKEQAYYHKDSVYSVWVSGVKPKIDSIKVYQKTVYNNVVEKRNALSLDLECGYQDRASIMLSATYGRKIGPITLWGGGGYDFIQKCPEIRLGVGYDIKWR